MSAADHGIGAQHHVLLYEQPGDFVEGVGAFLRDGLREGDRVLAAVGPDRLRWLRDDLGPDADAVDVMDADSLYQRHGSMLRLLLGYVERHAGPEEGRVRIVAESELARRSPADIRAYMRYEAAANLVYSRYPVSVLCPYDAVRLPEAILQDALRTHPQVMEHDDPRQNGRFADPRAFVRERVERRVPRDVPTCGLDRLDDLALARALVRDQAETAGFPAHDVEDLTIAVSEVAANALVHGEPPRTVSSYVDDGALVCHVRDAGTGPTDPLSGYLPPDASRLDGRGLWLAHQLCEIVEVVTDDVGTDVYLQMRVPSAA